MPQDKRFQRSSGTESYRRVFIIYTEGTITEPRYFSMFNYLQTQISVKCKGYSPARILKKMEEHLKNTRLRHNDEAWVVIDKDGLTDRQLEEFHKWSQKKENYGFALSNPKFEFWLLLHCEEGKKINGARDCSERLKKYPIICNKEIQQDKFNVDMIRAATKRAQQLDNPPCADWPRSPGLTTVYKLVAKLQA